MKTREAIVAFSALSAVGLAAATLTYTGENGGGFALAGNWDGGVAPGAGDSVVIPDGKVVHVTTPEDVAALTAVSSVTLDGVGAQIAVRDTPVDFVAGKASLSGTGQFRAVGTGTGDYTVRLVQDNSAFAGSFFFSNVIVHAHSPEAVGGQAGGSACPIEVYLGSKSTHSYNFKGAGTYYNPIRLDASGTWFGLYADAPGAVTNEGSIAFWDSARKDFGSRIRQGKAQTFVQKGLITLEGLGGGFDADVVKGGRIVFDNAIAAIGRPCRLCMDSGGMALLGPNFSFTNASSIDVSSGQTAPKPLFSFMAADLLGHVPLLVIGRTTGGTSGYNMVDLNGFDQAVGGVKVYTANGAQEMNVITSLSGPATLAVTNAFDNAGTCSVDWGGHVTLELAAASHAGEQRIVNLGGRVSDTDGGIRVTRGTLRALKGWNVPNISRLHVGRAGSDDAAKLVFDSPEVVVNPRVFLSVEGEGRLEIPSGMTLTVGLCKAGDAYLDAGPHANEPWLEGGGTLYVMCGGVQAGDFVWCGAEGAPWTAATSWTVDGAPAVRAPGTGDRAVVRGPAVVTAGDGDACVLEALAGLVLLEPDARVTITNRLASLKLSAELSGTGVLGARDVGYAGDAEPPQADVTLSGDSRAFAGSFWFTNTTVRVASAHSLGAFCPVTFWGWLSPASPYASTHLPLLIWEAAGEYRNPLFLYGGGQGTAAAVCEGGVTNWGPVVYWNPNAVVRVMGQGYLGSVLTKGKKGEVVLGGGIRNINPLTGEAGKGALDLNGNCAVVGDTPIDVGADGGPFSDSGTLRWGAPVTSMRHFSALELTFLRAYVDVNAAHFLCQQTAQSWVCDLNGFDQQFKGVSARDNKAIAEDVHSITSGAPATVTFRGTSAKCGHFTLDGAASLVLDAPGGAMAWTNAHAFVSSTTGGVFAAAGTLTLRDGLQLPAVSEIGAGKEGSTDAAVLAIATADVRIGPATKSPVVARLDGVGKVSLPADYALTVWQCTTNGVHLRPGAYTKTSLPDRVAGEGTLVVRRGASRPPTLLVFR